MFVPTRLHNQPFTLAEFRDHVGIDYTDDDAALTRALDSAASMWETNTNFFLRATTALFDLDFVENTIPSANVPSSVTVTKRSISDGTSSTDSDRWEIGRGSGMWTVRLAPGKSFDSSYRYEATLLLAAPAVMPPEVKAAVFGLGLHLFRHRGVGEEAAFATVPYSVRAILGNYQRGSI